MRVKISRQALQHLKAVCSFRTAAQFPGKLFVGRMVQTELSKLEKLIESKAAQASATIDFTDAQLVCLEALMQAYPTNPSTLVILEYVMQPIIKQIL